MNLNIKVTPIIPYSNAEKYKFIIYNENKGKSGIYRWNNFITGKSYIGFAKSLNTRLANYYSIRTINKKLSKSSSAIYSAILKYGYSNFSLDIIEYCNPILLIKKEQYYIDLLKPEYNICKKAGFTLGRKFSFETLLKFKNRKLSLEAINNLKKAKVGIAPTSPLRQINHILATGHATIIRNITDNTSRMYYSMKAAARDLNVSCTTIKNYLNTNKLLNNKYMINKKK